MDSLDHSSRYERSYKDGCWLKKRRYAVFAIFAADTGVFEPAPGCLRIVGHVIDHDTAGPQMRRHAACALDVSPQDGGVETVFGVVGNADRFVLGVIGDHTEHGAENLFLGDGHAVLHIDEHRWLHEPTCFETLRVAFSSDQHLRAFFNAFPNVGFHALILFLRYHGSNHDVGIGRIADREGTHLIPYGPLHLVKAAPGHEKPCSRRTSLTTVHKGQGKSRRNGLVEGGVIEQDG